MNTALISDNLMPDNLTSDTSVSETSFRAMGSDVHVMVWGDQELTDQLVALAPLRMELLEQSWSRFRADSELSRNNANAGGVELPISEDLLELVTAMQSAAAMTGDLFNPTMARIIDALGYNVDFAELTAGAASPASAVAAIPVMSPTTGIHLRGGHLALDAGVALDPGALGKGLAGDILCREFRAAGATGVLANIGGDIVVSGTPGSSEWCVGVVNERDHSELLTTIQSPAESLAVATSTTARRVWGNGVHHVIDPRTGAMSTTDLIQATVSADRGWIAEAYATAAMVLGFDQAHTFLLEHIMSLFLVRNNGEVASA